MITDNKDGLPDIAVYTALITQSGTAAPTVIQELQNTIGITPTFERIAAGNYGLVITGELFRENRTTVRLFTAGLQTIASGYRTTANNIAFLTYMAGVGMQDAVLGIATLEIKVYNEIL